MFYLLFLNYVSNCVPLKTFDIIDGGEGESHDLPVCDILVKNHPEFLHQCGSALFLSV